MGPPIMSRRQTCLVAACVIAMTCLSLMYAAARRIAESGTRARCGLRLKSVYETMCWNGVFGKPPAYQLVVRAGHATCEGCGQPYVYSPPRWATTRPIERLGVGTLTVVVSCPTPCHAGGRNVILLNGVVEWWTEKEYQSNMQSGS